MKKLVFTLSIFSMIFIPSIHPQDQSIFIFDPNDVSSSFQSTLSQLTDDFVFVADTLDDEIFNYDASFLFISPPYILSQGEGYRLTEYTSLKKPVYIFTGMFPGGLDTVTFWNHIGVDDMYGLLLSVPVDTVFGVSGQFTSGVIIDTNFMSGLIPEVIGNVDSILIGDAGTWEINTTYISGYDSLNVIIDLYNLIYNQDFLQRVLVRFGLIPPNDVGNDYSLLTDFKLFQNYPNPFNPVTSIQYAVGSRQFVSLKVYDVLGNEVATLVNEEKQSGTYEVEFSLYSDVGRNLPSGVYFYQLKVRGPETSSGQGFIATKKMVLLK